MVRTYIRGNGKRASSVYDQGQVEAALEAIRNGVSQAKASKTYGVPRATLQNKLKKKHPNPVGRPPVLSRVEEKMLVETVSEVSKWGYPLTPLDFKFVVKHYLDSSNRNESRFNNNMPGDDFVYSFAKRNSLSLRFAGNIKRARSRIGAEEISEYFTNLQTSLDGVDPHNIYNYDETNLTDDPGAKKVMVRRGTKRVERVQEHSRTSVSLMVCGNAAEELLPPFIVYKAQNLYENWTAGGPDGSKFDVTPSGWFDTRTFERWFFEVFIPHASAREGTKVLIGDNLASHFSPEVVKAAIESDIYFTALPPNSTHLTQPLDVAFFRPLKLAWRNILDTWRKESRRLGTIPKEVFPALLRKLWEHLEAHCLGNLTSGFTATGLYPLNPSQVLKHLPGSSNTQDRHPDDIGRSLDSSLVKLLEDNRGKRDESKCKRGKKIRVTPGKQIMETDVTHPEGVTLEDNAAGPSGSQDRPKTDNENQCYVCDTDYNNYSGPEWLQCVFCLVWVCGDCNGGEYNANFACPDCK